MYRLDALYRPGITSLYVCSVPVYTRTCTNAIIKYLFIRIPLQSKPSIHHTRIRILCKIEYQKLPHLKVSLIIIALHLLNFKKLSWFEGLHNLDQTYAL